MKPRPSQIVLTLCLMLGSASAAQAGQQAPEDVVRAFFDLYPHIRYHGPAEQADRPALKRLMSPSLMALLIAADEAENARSKIDPDPSEISGDIWVSNFEGASTSLVQSCTISGAQADCPVDLRYGDDQKEPLRWTDHYILILNGGQWWIDDVIGSRYRNVSLRKLISYVVNVDSVYLSGH